jgi:hypothetical protein
MRKAVLGVALALWLAPPSHAATRIVYSSAWSGSMELYGVDPSTAKSTSSVLPMERTVLSATDVTRGSWTADWSTRTAHASTSSPP